MYIFEGCQLFWLQETYFDTDWAQFNKHEANLQVNGADIQALNLSTGICVKEKKKSRASVQCNSLTSNAENHQMDASLHLDLAQTAAHKERRTGKSLCAGQGLLTLSAKAAASLHCSLKQDEFNGRKEVCPYCWKNEYSGREMERCFVDRLVFLLGLVLVETTYLKLCKAVTQD